LWFPLCGLQVSLGQNPGNGAVFSVTSIVRSYALRRVFDGLGRSSTGAANGL
jgi:hypothetical protein